MRKKSLIIPIAIIALVAFGSVTSANAFIDPISLSVIIGSSFLTLVTASETIKHIKTESAKEHVNILKLKKTMVQLKYPGWSHKWPMILKNKLLRGLPRSINNF